MKIYELIEDEGRYYIVSEYLEGGDLFERIEKSEEVSENDVAKIIL